MMQLKDHQYHRQPQPSTWNKALLERDGAGSGASVTVYRSTVLYKAGTVLNRDTRVPFEQKPKDDELQTYGDLEDQEIMGGEGLYLDRGKELMVVVKRGRNIDVTERTPDHLPLEALDIRNITGLNSWKRIKYGCTWEGKKEWKHTGRVREDRYMDISSDDVPLVRCDVEDYSYPPYMNNPDLFNTGIDSFVFGEAF